MESKLKRPSFQFYPGDWLNDAALRMCSIGARGLWIDMICIMHQGSEYGYLKVGGKVILPANLSRMCGVTLQETEGWLEELQSAGVYSIDDHGCIFSRRMIRDEEVRKARADGGSKGGNPSLTGKNKVDGKVNLPANLQPTPSSSSSFSSSSSKEEGKESALAEKQEISRHVQIAKRLRAAGCMKIQSGNPVLLEWVKSGYTDGEIDAAIGTLADRGKLADAGVKYLDAILSGNREDAAKSASRSIQSIEPAKPSGAWAKAFPR